MFPNMKPIVYTSTRELLDRFKNQYPTATNFIEFISDPEKKESLIENSRKTCLEKLMYGEEKSYFIEKESRVVSTLKKYFGMDLQKANLISAAEIVELNANLLTKNSPWTPIV